MFSRASGRKLTLKENSHLMLPKHATPIISAIPPIGQHLLENPECAKMCTDEKFRIIGQAESSFHIGVLESVYIKTQNPVLCRQKEFVVSLGLFNKEKGDSTPIGRKSN